MLDQPLNLTGSLLEIDGQPARDDKTVVVKLSGPIYLNGNRREACLLFLVNRQQDEADNTSPLITGNVSETIKHLYWESERFLHEIFTLIFLRKRHWL